MNIDRARSLRKNATKPEQVLWRQLRNRRFKDAKFRRQQNLGAYFVDFVCFEKKLIVELDGGQHATQVDYDLERSRWLEGQGYRVFGSGIMRCWGVLIL